MHEGWINDDYFVLFSEENMGTNSPKYNIEQLLPGYKVIGLRNWDNFIVRDTNGDSYSVPTVPLIMQYLDPFDIPKEMDLQPDERFIGRVKWYVTPLIFGGDASQGENLTWVSYVQHAELVTWWNAKYQEIKGASDI